MSRDNSKRLETLFQLYLKRQCTPAQLDELVILLQQADAEDILTDQMETVWHRIKEERTVYAKNWDKQYANIINTSVTKPIHSIGWKRVAVAASILLAISAASYFLFFKKTTDHGQQSTVKTTDDVPAPTIARATL